MGQVLARRRDDDPVKLELLSFEYRPGERVTRAMLDRARL